MVTNHPFRPLRRVPLLLLSGDAGRKVVRKEDEQANTRFVSSSANDASALTEGPRKYAASPRVERDSRLKDFLHSSSLTMNDELIRAVQFAMS